MIVKGSGQAGTTPAPAPAPADTAPAPVFSGGAPRLVEAPGSGAMPWENTPVHAPSPLVKPQGVSASTRLNLGNVDASRGVIGEIRRQAALQGVPVALALAVAKQESGYRQEAVSPAGAIGIMQLMPGTAQGLNVDPSNWKQNIEGGVRYLRQQYDSLHNWSLALAAYNAGYTAAKDGSWRNISETSNYVANVTAMAKQISNGTYKPSGGSTAIVMISAPLPGNPVVTSGFGPRGNPMGGGGDFHSGVDLAAPQGTPIHAMVGGKVTFSGWTDGTGNMVTIQDKSGRLWNYFHMVAPSPTKVGERVLAGRQIGNVGSTGMSTGPHLDIHLMVNGQYVNPMGLIRKAFRAGWDKTSKVTVLTTDFLPPGSGGVNGSGQSAIPSDGAMIVGVAGQDAQPAQSVDAAVVPGGQSSIPSNAAAWQRILASGPVSPETKNLAARAGAMVDTAQPLAAVYSNPGGGG